MNIYSSGPCEYQMGISAELSEPWLNIVNELYMGAVGTFSGEAPRGKGLLHGHAWNALGCKCGKSTRLDGHRVPAWLSQPLPMIIHPELGDGRPRPPLFETLRENLSPCFVNYEVSHKCKVLLLVIE